MPSDKPAATLPRRKPHGWRPRHDSSLPGPFVDDR